ncbi:MAG: YbjN domain-containing protein [Sandaracinaceae bacterium]
MSETPPTYHDRRTGTTYRDANEMVDDYLARFGKQVGVELDPLDEDGYTDVRRGSATVGINVLEEHGILLFLSRIMEVPKDSRETFYRRLLELNFLVTSDAAFAVDKDKDAVYLRALRRLSGLDFEEFEDLLHTMATVADEWDDRLGELFQDQD